MKPIYKLIGINPVQLSGAGIIKGVENTLSNDVSRYTDLPIYKILSPVCLAVKREIGERVDGK